MPGRRQGMRDARHVAQIDFGDGREMRIELGSPNGLARGAWIHRLRFPVTAYARNTMGMGVPFTLSGQARNTTVATV